MAITVEQLLAATGAELVANNLVLGEGPDRRFIGFIEDGILNLTDEGKDFAAEVEATGTAVEPKKPRARKPKADAATDAPAQ